MSWSERDTRQFLNHVLLLTGLFGHGVDERLFKKFCEDIGKVLATLSAREHELLAYKYGLRRGSRSESLTVRTYRETGDHFGVSQERARQIEAKALRKLRHPRRSKRLPRVDVLHLFGEKEEDGQQKS